MTPIGPGYLHGGWRMWINRIVMEFWGLGEQMGADKLTKVIT